MEPSDADVLRLVAGEDVSALHELYDRHSPWLAARLRHRCNDDEVVADVLQDTFVAVWRAADRWRGDGEVAAWIWGIAVRRLVSRLRGSPRATVLVDDALHRAVPPEASAEEAVLLGIEYGALGTALDRLSPELRAALQATVLDGLTAREAGRLLALPEGTVKSRIRKAKVLLRAELAATGEELPGWR